LNVSEFVIFLKKVANSGAIIFKETVFDIDLRNKPILDVIKLVVKDACILLKELNNLEDIEDNDSD
jgi:hypothetical protein